MVATAVDTGWTFAPVVVASLIAYEAIYYVRWRKVDASVWRLVSWTSGVLLIALALLSPLDRISDQLASAHMAQHLLLADLAPILLILGLTKVILRPVTKRVQTVERKAGPFGHPVFGIVAYVGAMWLWHIPAMYDAALHHAGVHVLEHLSFAAAGSLYWWHLISPIRSRLRLSGMGPIAYMFSTKLLVGMLGVGLAFAPELLYAYGPDGIRWGMSPLDDQQVAGALMGVEQSLTMGIALAWLFARMLAESDRADQREELALERATGSDLGRPVNGDGSADDDPAPEAHIAAHGQPVRVDE